MNRCLECGIGAGEKIIYNVRCEHYKLFFLLCCFPNNWKIFIVY